MLGLGLGMGVGNKASMLPVSAFPSIDAIPPGALVLDSDGGVKACRWAVELNGSDSLRFATSKPNLSGSDWSLSWLQSDRAISAVGNRLLNIFDSGKAVLRLNQIAGGMFRLSLSTDGSTTVAYIDTISPIIDTKFHKFSIEKIGNSIALIVDGIFATMSIGAWSVLTASIVEFRDSGADLRPLVLANIGQGDTIYGNDLFPCTESSGTVIANTYTPSRPATLSDPNAHVKALVPVSLST